MLLNSLSKAVKPIAMRSKDPAAIWQLAVESWDWPKQYDRNGMFLAVANWPRGRGGPVADAAARYKKEIVKALVWFPLHFCSTRLYINWRIRACHDTHNHQSLEKQSIQHSTFLSHGPALRNHKHTNGAREGQGDRRFLHCRRLQVSVPYSFVFFYAHKMNRSLRTGLSWLLFCVPY